MRVLNLLDRTMPSDEIVETVGCPEYLRGNKVQ
jgi:hypothetical protein